MLLAVGLFSGAMAIAVGVWCAFTFMPATMGRLSLQMHSILYNIQSMGWGAKLRIAIAFYQCISVIQTLYAVKLPTKYTDWMDTADVVSFDLTSLIVPNECLGSFRQRLLMASLLPLVLICLVVGYKVVRRRRASLYAACLSALSPSLIIVFIFAPSTNLKIFQIWDCEPYEFSDGEDHYYMRASLGIQCYTAKHREMYPAFFVFMALWPIGSLALFAGLSLRGRRRLLDHSPDQFIRDIGFLHGHFKPKCYVRMPFSRCRPHGPLPTRPAVHCVTIPPCVASRPAPMRTA